MLSIGKLGQGQADYYLKAVGQGIEDYYSGDGEAPGWWTGTAAEELDVFGHVDGELLHRALNGKHPATGDQLARPPRGAIRVPGFDLTFSAPKSVSVLYALGDDDVRSAVRDAHDAAVQASLGYMERHAAMGRRGRGGTQSVFGNGFLAAAFRHRTSRAGDPQLHTHVLVANMTRGPDGRWTALDGRRLYAHAKTGGYLYQAQLRAELVRTLGLRFTPVRRGVGEIDGLPKPLLKAFSRRRTEVEAELERRGETSATAAQVATLDSRQAKQYDVSGETLHERWHERAREHDFKPARTTDLLHTDAPRGIQESDVERVEEHLAGPEGLTRQRASFTRRDVVQAWCEQLPQGADLPLVEDLAERLVTSRHVVSLATDVRQLARADLIRRTDGRLIPATADERRFSTPELLALEQRILEQAERTGQGPRARVAHTALDGVLTSRSELSDEQATMVRRLCADGDPVAVVVGKAGTGKTFALDVARQAWQEDGYRVIGAALARRAAEELEHGAGIESTTIAALLLDLRRDPAALLDARTVLVVDEAGMAGTRQLAELLDHADRAHAKVVLVGDHRQLPEIEAGGAFRGLVARGHAIALEENRRQEQPWEREALDLLREGRAGEALDAYHQHGRVHTAQTAADVRGQLVADWWTSHERGEPAVMLAIRRSDVADLNQRARGLMLAAGALSGPELAVDHRVFRVGDEVVCLKNDRRLGVANGTRGTVTGLDTDAPTLTLIRPDGRELTLPARYLDDRTQRGGPTVDHGYALTAHKAQGMTTGTAFVLGSSELYREAGYVALSRGRRENHLYLVTPDAPDREQRRSERPLAPLAAAARSLAGSRAQTMAADAPLAAELAQRPTDALQAEQQALRRQLTATEGRQRTHGRLDEQRAAAERLLDDAEGRAATSGLSGDLAVARQAARRVADLRACETQLTPRGLTEPTTTQRRLAAIDAELEQRAARTGHVAELAPPGYLLAALGPRPERLAERAQWRQAAWRIEQARDATGHAGSHDALGTEPRELRARKLWHAAQREIERYRREVDRALQQRRDAPSQRELG
jgi:Ti-type conjugative transfer relaxase TraA